MTGPVTFTFYALLLLGDGQETEQRPISYGRTLEQCVDLIRSRVPSSALVDLGYGQEAVETVFGCEMETNEESDLGVGGGDLQQMFEAAQREDWQ
jgi:hypothetical protein